MEAKNINQLVTENLSYVKSLANRFKGKGVDFDDLVSEGYMAKLHKNMILSAEHNL